MYLCVCIYLLSTYQSIFKQFSTILIAIYTSLVQLTWGEYSDNIMAFIFKIYSSMQVLLHVRDLKFFGQLVSSNVIYANIITIKKLKVKIPMFSMQGKWIYQQHCPSVTSNFKARILHSMPFNTVIKILFCMVLETSFS